MGSQEGIPEVGESGTGFLRMEAPVKEVVVVSGDRWPFFVKKTVYYFCNHRGFA